jgi:hypothetical protein
MGVPDGHAASDDIAKHISDAMLSLSKIAESLGVALG